MANDPRMLPSQVPPTRRRPIPRNDCTAAAVWLTVPLSLALAFAPEAAGESVVYEGFAYETGDLNGRDGGQGDWSNSWNHSGGFRAGPDWQVTGAGLEYTDAGGRSLVTSGGAIEADPGGIATEFNATRPWDTTGHMDDGNTLWFSYLFQRSEGSHGQHLYILGSGSFRNGAGPFIGSSNSHIQARIQQSTSDMDTGGNLPFTLDDAHLVVGRITFSDDTGEDELRYWLDPELDAVPLDGASNSGATTGDVSATWSNFFVRNSGNGIARLDEIRIGTDFASVAPSDVSLPPTIIPTPGAVAMGLAMLGGIGATRPRRRHATVCGSPLDNIPGKTTAPLTRAG